MDETTGRIDYEVHGLTLGVPTRASVVIVRKYGGFLEDGTILLSHELKTEEEIDFCINDLKKNLDDVGRSANGICEKRRNRFEGRFLRIGEGLEL